MALSDQQADDLAQRFGSDIAAQAREQFDRLFVLIAEGMEAREAIMLVQSSFAGAFVDQLSLAFGELLQRSVGASEVKALTIGDLSLSRRLYLHNVQTAAETLGIIRDHARGVHQARELALKLYDGYDPAGAAARPLEGRARAELPKALRALTADPTTRQSLQQLIERGQAQAGRLKSQALRAAYSEAFDAWAAGEGEASIKRRLDIATREKNRYFASRIAQTELARAHQAQVASELMADPDVEIVQVMINPTHPKQDICDLHGRADLWGLGPGCYPKPKAPQPPYHPHCRCKLRSRPSLSLADAKRAPKGEAAYLGSLGNLSAAGRVMGSRERAELVIGGAPVDEVINAGKDPLYRLRRLGDDGSGHELVGPAPLAMQRDIRSPVSAEFVRNVDAALDMIPAGAQRLLHDKGAKIVMSKRLTDAYPHLRGVHPRGWPPGSTWDGAEGLASGWQKEFAISEEYVCIYTGRVVTSPRVEGVVLHEAGHIVDELLGAGRTQSWLDAHALDVPIAKSRPDVDLLGYYLQPGEAGPSEAFAEVFAQVCGSKGSGGTDLLSAFPNCARWIRNALNSLP